LNKAKFTEFLQDRVCGARSGGDTFMAVSYTTSRILDAYPYLDAKQVESRLAYGSFASVKDRFFYVEVPKAACTTIKMLLRELHNSSPLKLFIGRARETRRSMFIHSRENSALPSLNNLDKKDQRDLLEAPDVLRFTVVRNPYTRLLSAWRDKVFLCEPGVDSVYSAIRGSAPALNHKDLVKFAEFVSYIERSEGHPWNEHWQKQVDLTLPKGIPYTHIGKVEELQSTIAILTHHLRRQAPIIAPRANEGSIQPLANFSTELAERIHTLYEEDFATFGYGSDAWPRDEQAPPAFVSTEVFVDEVLERNLIIAHLYDERDRSILRRVGSAIRVLKMLSLRQAAERILNACLTTLTAGATRQQKLDSGKLVPFLKPPSRFVEYFSPRQLRTLLIEVFVRNVPPRLQRVSEALFNLPIPKHIRDRELLFIHVPKNAGTTIAVQLYGSQVAHRPASYYYDSDRDWFLSRKRFAVVRNPWDRAVSAYEFMRRAEKGLVVADPKVLGIVRSCETFEKFVTRCLVNDTVVQRDPTFLPQHYFLYSKLGKCLVENIFRFEDLSSLEEWLDACGVPFARSQFLNKSQGRSDYRSYYTKNNLIEIVGRFYADDIARFNYQF
jgi:chondroitin 4-sulfotransferase 11